MGEDGALAGGGALVGLQDAAAQIGQLRLGEAGAAGHALPQRQLGMRPQRLDRGGRRLQHVAELRVVADAQGGDAVALGEIALQRAEHAAAVVAQPPLGIQLGIEARGDRTPVLDPRRRRFGQRGGEPGAQAGRGGERLPCGGEQGRRVGAEGRCGRLRRGERVAHRGEVARQAAPEREPAERAGEVGGGAQRGTQRSRRLRLCHEERPRILPRRDRDRIGERRRNPGAEQPRAGGGQRTLHRGEQRVRGAAVAGAGEFEARPRRRVERHRAGLALWRRARQARQPSGLRRPHRIEGEAGRHRLGVGEGAERIEAGRPERLRDRAARGERRFGGRLGRAPRRPVGKVEVGGCHDLRRIEPAEQRREVARRHRRGLEQPGRDVEPGRPQGRAGDGQRQQQVRPHGIQQRVLDQRPRRHQSDDLAADRRAALPRRLHLLDDRDAVAAPDQAGEIEFRGRNRHAAHRDRRPVMGAAGGQRDVEAGRRRLCVVEEQLVEIAHAEEQQCLGMHGLEREPLRHRGRCRNGKGCAGRLRRRVAGGQAVHPASLTAPGPPAKGWVPPACGAGGFPSQPAERAGSHRRPALS